MNQKEKEQYYYNHKKKEINIDKIFSIIGEILQIVLYPVCMVGWAMPVFIIYKNLVHQFLIAAILGTIIFIIVGIVLIIAGSKLTDIVYNYFLGVLESRNEKIRKENNDLWELTMKK
jgi:hypothetical protein